MRSVQIHPWLSVPRSPPFIIFVCYLAMLLILNRRLTFADHDAGLPSAGLVITNSFSLGDTQESFIQIGLGLLRLKTRKVSC